MGSTIRVQTWSDGAVSFESSGEDDSVTVLSVLSTGARRCVTSQPWQRPHVGVMVTGGGYIDIYRVEDDAMWPIADRFDPIVRSELGDGFFGKWKLTEPIIRDLPDGGQIKIIREGDGTGHYWEHGSRSEGMTDTVLTPGRDWTRSWHPSKDAEHPNGGQGGQSYTEWGTVHEPKGAGGGDTHYTTVSEKVSDGHGGTFTITWGESYNPTTGEREKSADVEQPDGSSYRAWRSTDKDGNWRETRLTKDKDGNCEKRIITGNGDETTSDTGPVPTDDEGGTSDQDPPPPDKDEKTSQPAGDGGGGYEEGNPDGPWTPFDLVKLRGSGSSSGSDHIDTLGDANRLLGPLMGRLRAAAKSGVGGGSSGDLLDTLGAPPFAGQLLIPVTEDDELKDLDSLGKPHPIHTTWIDVEETNGLAALSVGQLDAAAQRWRATGHT